MERTTPTSMSLAWDKAAQSGNLSANLNKLKPILEAAGLLDACEITKGSVGPSSDQRIYTALSLLGDKTILAFNFKPEHVFVFPVMRSEEDTDSALVAELQDMSEADFVEQVVTLLGGHAPHGGGQPCTADNHPDFIKRGISVIETGPHGVMWPVKLREALDRGIDTPKSNPTVISQALELGLVHSLI